MKEICDKCGKRQKRFRVAFGSYLCDNCKVETFVKLPSFVIPNWWARLSEKQKQEIYNTYKVKFGE